MGIVVPMQTLRHVVIGTDFSACADRALAVAVALAAAAGARLTLVHVREPGLDDTDEERLAQCEEKLTAIAARHRVEIARVLRFGRPWEKLENVATEVGAGLIVVGRHGAGHGRPLGSVAALLLRTSSRPVLTVPEDQLSETA